LLVANANQAGLQARGASLGAPPPGSWRSHPRRRVRDEANEFLVEAGSSTNETGVVSGFAPPGDIHRVRNTGDRTSGRRSGRPMDAPTTPRAGPKTTLARPPEEQLGAVPAERLLPGYGVHGVVRCRPREQCERASRSGTGPSTAPEPIRNPIGCLRRRGSTSTRPPAARSRCSTHPPAWW
jgi:hypothetical protein